MIRSTQFTIALGFAAAITVVAVTLTADQSTQTVQLRDDCDPITFNADPPAGVGPGTCIGDGDTTFQEFIAELQDHHRADKWRFNPDRTETTPSVTARNRGGETHTFTQVKSFGGGFIDILNQLSNNPDPAPECALPAVLGSAVPAGHTSDPIRLEPGKTYRFQCCIHPWMRTTFTAK
jgi:hypothetical protein